MAAFRTLTEPLPAFTAGQELGVICPFAQVQVYTEVAAEAWWTRVAGPPAQSSSPRVQLGAGTQQTLWKPLWADILNLRAQAAGLIQVAPAVTPVVDVVQSGIVALYTRSPLS